MPAMERSFCRVQGERTRPVPAAFLCVIHGGVGGLEQHGVELARLLADLDHVHGQARKHLLPAQGIAQAAAGLDLLGRGHRG